MGRAGYNPGAMLVSDVGEFGLIERLNRLVTAERGSPDNAAPAGFRLLVDTGDDTAAWQPSPSAAAELCTTDTMVEGVHFTRATTPWRDLGWKGLAANVSDVAAMGGRPAYAVVTLGLPPDTPVAGLEEMYRGMLDLGRRFGVSIVGGDVVRSPVFFVTVALTGVTDGPPLLRSAARPGDAVAVSGWLGSSAGGLRLLLDAGGAAEVYDAAAAEFLRQAHRRPLPHTAAGQRLAEAGIRAAMDVSDGLADDLGKLCRASGVAAVIEAAAVPVHPHLRRQFPADGLALALGGGEDYVLLFTGPPEIVAPLLPELPEGAAVVGEIVPGIPGAVTLSDDGAGGGVRRQEIITGGWDHFAAAGPTSS